MLYGLSIWDTINAAQTKIILLTVYLSFLDVTEPFFYDVEQMKLESCSVYLFLLLVFKLMNFCMSRDGSIPMKM